MGLAQISVVLLTFHGYQVAAMAPDITSSHNSIQQEGRAGAFFLSLFFFLTSESDLSCKIPVDFTVGLSAQTDPYAHPASTLVEENGLN